MAAIVHFVVSFASRTQIALHQRALYLPVFPTSRYKMSSHCHDEHNDEHNHSGHGDGHDHTDDITPALQYSLWQHIDFNNITTLNESEIDSGKEIVKKTWAERLLEQPELESDADEQLMMHIPFVWLLSALCHLLRWNT